MGLCVELAHSRGQQYQHHPTQNQVRLLLFSFNFISLILFPLLSSSQMAEQIPPPLSVLGASSSGGVVYLFLVM